MQTVIVIDYGSEVTQLIARRVREAGVYSEILPCTASLDKVKQAAPAAIILPEAPAGQDNALGQPLQAGLPDLGLPILKIQGGECDEQVIRDFLFKTAALAADWSMAAFIDRAVESMKKQIGDKKVVCALSGGVDSTVTAVLLNKAIGKNLYCIFVDTGLMRHNEAAWVTSMLSEGFGLNLKGIDASDLFLGRLKGVTDPEEKRKIIGHAFIEVFDEAAKSLGQVDFLAQGTIYPDVIESISVTGKVVKSHHNVGGLPDHMKMSLVEPLRELFKDEVRAVGRELGLPDEFVWRHPFPGPGLAVRVLGEVTKDRLDVLRQADLIVTEEMRASGWYGKVWQSFPVLLPLRTVGMKNGGRSYEHVIALRVVESVDAMTAIWTELPGSLLRRISSRICSEVQGVNRVVYDISSKPPATIEWE
ncbi:MAG: glutamine-hydrolyzing GMP synthase [Deltaproteobacteria bacterium]|jgi:GMP synthase (glutamine-hydrolysing)|nr:glutamine-hydrolyzing GMP synthase [Deltaproteobacteria bacterium]